MDSFIDLSAAGHHNDRYGAYDDLRAQLAEVLSRELMGEEDDRLIQVFRHETERMTEQLDTFANRYFLDTTPTEDDAYRLSQLMGSFPPSNEIAMCARPTYASSYQFPNKPGNAHDDDVSFFRHGL